MKNLLKKYFLYVAEWPIKRSFFIAVGLFIILSIIRAFLSGVPGLSFSAEQAYKFSLIAFVVLLAINTIIPAIFVTYFFSDQFSDCHRLVLLRRSGYPPPSFIYSRPIWGKIPYAEIIFPENWDLQEPVQKQTLDLGVILRISSKQLAFLTFQTTISFNGLFQAGDLEELIRQQGPNSSHKTKFYFQKCLQEIVSRYLSDRRELITEDLIKWQNREMTTKDLEKKWIDSEIIFQGIFNNIENWKMKLLAPEIKKTHER